MHVLFILIPLALAVSFPCLIRRAQLLGLRGAISAGRRLGID